MPVGFRAVTGAGVVQIDENHLCLSLRAKGALTATAAHVMSQGSTWLLRYRDLTFTSADVPIVAVRVTEANQYAGVIAVTRSGNVWTFRVLVMGQATNSFQFQYWIFDRPSAPTSSGLGLIVKDGANRVVFNSNDPVIRVVGQGPGDYGSGRIYAFAYSSVINYFHEIVDNTPTGWLTLESIQAWGCRATPTGVQRALQTVFGNVLNGDAPPQFAPGSGLNGWGGGDVNYGFAPAEMSMLVLDVTGM